MNGFYGFLIGLVMTTVGIIILSAEPHARWAVWLVFGGVAIVVAVLTLAIPRKR